MHFEFCEMGQIVTHGTRNVVIALKNMCVVILRNMAKSSLMKMNPNHLCMYSTNNRLKLFDGPRILFVKLILLYKAIDNSHGYIAWLSQNIDFGWTANQIDTFVFLHANLLSARCIWFQPCNQVP